MIVTRQRRKPFRWRRFILPVAAIVLVAAALTWAPSRNVITSGPAAPAWRVASSGFDTVATPFHFAAQNQAMTDLKHQIVVLQGQVADAQSKSQVKDKKISDLQATISQLQTQAATAQSSAAPALKPQGIASPAAGAGAGAFSATAQSGYVSGDLSAGATPDMRRTADYWTNMDPDNAAKVVQKLPIPYVAHIFALMSPDAVSSILDALPANYVAELTQDHPELRK